MKLESGNLKTDKSKYDFMQWTINLRQSWLLYIEAKSLAGFKKKNVQFLDNEDIQLHY